MFPGLPDHYVAHVLRPTHFLQIAPALWHPSYLYMPCCAVPCFALLCCALLQVVFSEASAAAGHTVDRVISIMDASGLTLSALTGFAQRVRQL